MVLAILLSVCSLEVQAQKQNITGPQLSKLQSDAYDKLKSISYRRTMKSESYKNVNDSSPYYFVTSLLEFAPPDKSHYIYENKTVDGINRTETITIGKKKYQLSNNGNWKDITTEQQGFGGGSGTAVESEKTVEY